MKHKRILVTVFSIILIVLISIFIWAYLVLNASLPDKEGEIALAGIVSEVSIFFDAKGIPQIWAENEQDAWYALGWLHAGDRLFQMEITRRVAYGRLSELFGELTLSMDRRQRIFGHEILAEKNLPELQQPYKKLLEAYSLGVNQWVNHTSALPFEFYLLGTEFEPWSVKDCLTILNFQTLFSNDLQNTEDFFISLEKQVGRKKAEDVIAPYPPGSPKTVPQNEDLTSSSPSYLEIPDAKGWQHYFYQSLFPGGKTPFLLTEASNAWAISAEKSQSGQAMLASDPHLEISRLPQFWYVVGLHTQTDSLNVLGITTPGIPLVIMGHNGKIAWAFTAGGNDVMDEYTERLNPENMNEYQVGEKFVPFDIRWEYINVRDWDRSDSLQIKTTRHGPVVEENEENQEVYALKWAGFDQSAAVAIPAGFQLMRSTTYGHFRQAVTKFAALDANWIYADKEGNIGYQLGTPIPIRQRQTRQSRNPGWDSRFEWLGYRSLDETPHAINPQKGWLATCNNKPDQNNLNYPVYGNYADDRIQRISELLSAGDSFSLMQMKDFQLDLNSIALFSWKEEVKRILIQINHQQWLKIIEEWQGNTNIDSKATALVETWLSIIKGYTFEDDFPELSNKFFSRIQYRDRNFYRIYFDRESTWFDDIRTAGKVETRDEVTIKAMRKAIEMVGKKRWGDVQTLVMAHPMAQVPVVSSLLSLKRGPFPRSGTTGSLNNSTAYIGEQGEFIGRGGPSWRFLIDFDDINNTQMVIPSGQSGNPMSEHFFDFYDLWFNGDYWTVPFDLKGVKEHMVSHLSLIPIKEE